MTENLQRSQVTRQDRAIQNEAWIAGFLQEAGAGTVSTAQDGQPYSSMLLFAYDPDQHAIYFHTARRGRVWENLLHDPRACFSAYSMGRLLPAETALNFSVEYQSVVAFGSASLVDDAAEVDRGLQLILDKYFPHLRPGEHYRPIVAAERAITALFRLDIEEWSGKQKAVEGDVPGSFLWEDRLRGQ